MHQIEPIPVDLDYPTDFIAGRATFYILCYDLIIVSPVLLKEGETVSSNGFYLITVDRICCYRFKRGICCLFDKCS